MKATDLLIIHRTYGYLKSKQSGEAQPTALKSLLVDIPSSVIGSECSSFATGHVGLQECLELLGTAAVVSICGRVQ